MRTWIILALFGAASAMAADPTEAVRKWATEASGANAMRVVWISAGQEFGDPHGAVRVAYLLEDCTWQQPNRTIIEHARLDKDVFVDPPPGVSDFEKATSRFVVAEISGDKIRVIGQENIDSIETYPSLKSASESLRGQAQRSPWLLARLIRDKFSESVPPKVSSISADEIDVWPDDLTQVRLRREREQWRCVGFRLLEPGRGVVRDVEFKDFRLVSGLLVEHPFERSDRTPAISLVKPVSGLGEPLTWRLVEIATLTSVPDESFLLDSPELAERVKEARENWRDEIRSRAEPGKETDKGK